MVVALSSCPARLRYALSRYLSLDFGLFNRSFTFLLMLTFSFDLWQLEGSPIVVAQNEKFDGKEFSECYLFAAKLCNHFGILCRRSKVLHWESGMVITSMLVETSDKLFL